YYAPALSCNQPSMISEGQSFNRNPPRRIVFTHEVSSPFTLPRRTNSAIRLSTHSMPSTPLKPCPPLGTTTCRLFRKFFAASSPYFGGVTGSHWPVSINAGTFDLTAVR